MPVGRTADPYEPRDAVIADDILAGDRGDLVAMADTVRFTWQSNILSGAAADGNIPGGVSPTGTRGW